MTSKEHQILTKKHQQIVTGCQKIDGAVEQWSTVWICPTVTRGLNPTQRAEEQS